MCLSPAATWLTVVPISSMIFLGWVSLLQPPCPSWPHRPLPQLNTPPSMVSATVCSSPATSPAASTRRFRSVVTF